VQRIKIIRGEDKRLVLFFKNSSSCRPINLEEATNVQFVFEKSDRSEVVLDMVQIPAVSASYSYNGGKFTAVVPGSTGNLILLQFNGTDTIDTVVDAWNTANPLNQVGYTGLIGTFVPLAMNVRLANGLNAYTPVSITNAVIGEVSLIIEDKITNSLKLGDNQTFKTIIDFGDAPQGTRRKAKSKNILDVSA
jgi:hypothetical protein